MPAVRGWVRGTAALLVALVVVGAAAVVLALRWHTAHDLLAQRAAARATAEQVALELSSLSVDTASARLDALKAQATGAFFEQLNGFGPALGTVVEQGKVEAKGTVTGAGIERLSGPDASALVAVSAVVASSVLAAPEVRHYRLALTLHRDGGKWLVSGVETVK